MNSVVCWVPVVAWPWSSPQSGGSGFDRRLVLESWSSHARVQWVYPKRRLPRSELKVTVLCSAEGSQEDGVSSRPLVQNVAVVLLAGGVGKRMKADRPKQFLELGGKTVLRRSLELFLGMPDVVSEVVLVLEENARKEYSHPRVIFASPGRERQDSVYNGLQQVSGQASLVAVHDSARPLVTREKIMDVLTDAAQFGAAVLGVPSKATIKESEDGKFVLRTIDRSRLWEIQTPQVIQRALLQRGFDKVNEEKLVVTDDVSIVEHLGEPVRITMGEYTNIKLTTPEDLAIAESILRDRGDLV